MTLVLNTPPFQQLQDELFEAKELKVYVLRDDLIHPFVSGNKWRKMKYNISEFQRLEKEYLVTFGGAYSNHIVATAAAGKECGIKTIGIIRGEELNNNSNAQLKFASECGMKLIFVSREKYRSLRESSVPLLSELQIPEASLFILPEGGSNEFAVKGCKEIVDDCPIQFDYIACACGTGTTLAGIIESLKNHQQAIGVSVLKDGGSIAETIKKFTRPKENYQVLSDYHFGRYGRSTKELEDFCRSFNNLHQVPVEPVYTGKLFFGIYDLIHKDFFERGKTIVTVHTGGVLNFSTKSDQQ